MHIARRFCFPLHFEGQVTLYHFGECPSCVGVEIERNFSLGLVGVGRGAWCCIPNMFGAVVRQTVGDHNWYHCGSAFSDGWQRSLENSLLGSAFVWPQDFAGREWGQVVLERYSLRLLITFLCITGKSGTGDHLIIAHGSCLDGCGCVGGFTWLEDWICEPIGLMWRVWKRLFDLSLSFAYWVCTRDCFIRVVRISGWKSQLPSKTLTVRTHSFCIEIKLILPKRKDE